MTVLREEHILYSVLIVFLTVASYTDIKYSKIYNIWVLIASLPVIYIRSYSFFYMGSCKYGLRFYPLYMQDGGSRRYKACRLYIRNTWSGSCKHGTFDLFKYCGCLCLIFFIIQKNSVYTFVIFKRIRIQMYKKQKYI